MTDIQTEVPTTRDATVRQEGVAAARAGRSLKDNPYRFGSADGSAWRQGFDEVGVREHP